MTPAIAYDHRAKSAAALVQDYIAKFMPQVPPPAAVDVVRMADMIDSASYPSIEFVFTDTSPMMVLRAFLELAYPSEMMYSRLVEVITRTGLDIGLANRVMEIDTGYVTKLRNKAIGVKNHIEVFGKMSVIRQRNPLQNPRYAECFAVNTKYNVRISDESKTEKRISIAYNKWYTEPNPINIGNYLKKAKHVGFGGGHFNIGGGIVLNDNVETVLDDFSLTVGE